MKIFKTPFATQGDRVAVPDEMQSDGSVSYTQGYSQDYEKEYDKAGAKDIERSKMNAIFHDITDAIGKGQSTGIYPWIKEAAPYVKGSFVYYNKEAFYSLVDNNSDTPADGAKWRALSKKQDALTFTGTGDVVRKSVTDALDKRVTTAQSSADSALKEAQSKQDKLEFVGTGNVVRKSVTDDLSTTIIDSTPIGIIHAYVSENPPNDAWLLCRGQTFSSSKYPFLAKIFPDLRVPDLRGVALRGLDAGKNYDPDRKLLTYQEDASQKIKVFIQGFRTASDFRTDSEMIEVNPTNTGLHFAGGSNTIYGSAIAIDTSKGIRTSHETVMKNVAVNFIIKAK